MAVKKYKPQSIPRFHERRVDDAIERATEIIQASKSCIDRSRELTEQSHRAMEASKLRRGV